MPPLPPIPNTASFELIYGSLGEVCENVFHVHMDPLSGLAWDTGNLTTFAASFVNWWTTNMKTRVGSGVTLNKCRARDIGAVNGAVLDYVTGLPSTGTRAGTQYPNNVTLAVSWRTGFSGRKNRGRTFHVGIMEDMVTGNTVNNANLTDLQGAYDTLRTQIGAVLPGGVAHLVVASRKYLSTQIITNTLIDNIVDSQRRRLPEHNRHR